MPDRRAFLRFLARDLVLLGWTAGAWALDAGLRAQGRSDTLALAVAVFAGLMAALVGFLLHEWGHWLGAAAAGGVLHAPRKLHSVFLFFFDVAKSSRRAFLWMSYGGYAASALGVGLMIAFLPRDAWSGRVALLAASIGMLVTFALEVPTTLRVARGGELPRGGVFADEDGHPKAVRPIPRAG